MDTVIENLVRAVRKLADAGVGRAVIASDHGHIYASRQREEAMRIDAPGGETVELHRRCWIGRGGATPSAAVRVRGQSLGYATDLDFVFPKGSGVFRAGGDLAFHHGGMSLQELVIPVISVRMSVSSAAAAAAAGAGVTIAEVPAAVTTRIFTVKVSFATLHAAPIRPVLMTDGRQVGAVGMVVGTGANHDRTSGIVTVPTGVEATIGFVLDDDQVSALQVVVIDPESDAELYRSPADIPVQLGVA